MTESRMSERMEEEEIEREGGGQRDWRLLRSLSLSLSLGLTLSLSLCFGGSRSLEANTRGRMICWRGCRHSEPELS